ncbi:MAG TPA: ABC transporter permease [Candidatus Acidoferrales bacterium]|nr:ABC transporter permease [Candidatus Acidoferrales bacterium]
MAMRTLGRNKLRAGLTLLGITIAISAVICTVAIGQGGSDMIRDQLAMLGDNLVWVEAGNRNVQGVRTGNFGSNTLTMDDLHAIVQSVPVVKRASPQVDSRAQVVYGNQNWSTTYRGVSPEYLDIRLWAVAEGNPFTHEDVENFAGVCLLGQTVTRILFPAEDPIGKTIRVKTLPCKVVGVLAPKGMSVTGQDQDDFILMPYTTVQNKVRGVTWLDDIMCSVRSRDAVRPARDMITRLLRERHHIREGAPEDFNIRTPDETLKVQEDASNTFTMMLASIASVSLLVGGIGIMNIMLVSVTERTREIGVRMAVGATEGDVQRQFLAEAVTLSLIGGAIGIPGGILSSFGISSLLGWPISISLTAVGVAFLFALGVGIFFGYYPAQKASRLDPIEALRYE